MAGQNEWPSSTPGGGEVLTVQWVQAGESIVDSGLRGPRLFVRGTPPGPSPLEPGQRGSYAMPAPLGWYHPGERVPDGLGPPGTVWQVGWQYGDPAWPTDKLDLLHFYWELGRLVLGRKLPWSLGAGEVGVGIYYVVPSPEEIDHEDPDGGGPMTTLKAIKCGVHATLGSEEEVLHAFHLVPQGSGSLDSVDATGLAAVGDVIKGLWEDFFEAEAYTGNNVNSLFTTALVYDEVRVTLVEYKTPVVVDGKLDYCDVLLPTVFRGWASGAPAGTGTQRVPNSDALCLSFLTAQRNRAARGRVFLGGLNLTCFDTSTGLFDTTRVRGVGTKFGDVFVDGIHAADFSPVADLDLAVVSAKAHVANKASNAYYGPSALGVGGIKVGRVPDTQRRRRSELDEEAYLAWGSLPS